MILSLVVRMLLWETVEGLTGEDCHEYKGGRLVCTGRRDVNGEWRECGDLVCVREEQM